MQCTFTFLPVASSYRPPYPRPSSGRLHALGLKARITYGDKLRRNRDITARTMGFISWWKERCTTILNDLAWRIDRLDWQEVAERIQKEEATKAEQEAHRIVLSPTPYLDDVAKAAARLGHDFDLVVYQILAHAERNNFCHSGRKAMIQFGHFQELAERLFEDKKAPGVIFQSKSQDQVQMRAVMKTIEKEWFEKTYWDEATKVRHYRYQDMKARVRFSLTYKEVEKMRKIAQAN